MYVGNLLSFEVDEEENSLDKSLDTDEEYIAGSELRLALGGLSGSGGGFSYVVIEWRCCATFD